MALLLLKKKIAEGILIFPRSIQQLETYLVSGACFIVCYLQNGESQSNKASSYLLSWCNHLK